MKQNEINWELSIRIQVVAIIKRSSGLIRNQCNSVRKMNVNREKVRLELYADAVPGVDGHLRQKGNPFAVVTLLANTPQELPTILGRTETIQNESDPRWIKYFDLEFEFTQNKRINIAVFDEINLGKEERIGSAVFEIGEVLGTQNNVKAKRLGKSGSIFARITRVPDVPDTTVNFKLRCVDLMNVEGLLYKPDTFFELAAEESSFSSFPSWLPMFRSMTVDETFSPYWDSCSVSVNRVCGGDFDKPVQFNMFSYKKTGRHFHMGSFESSIHGLCQAAKSNTPGGLTADSMPYIGSLMTKRSNEFYITRMGKPVGKICVEKAEIVEEVPETIVWKNAAENVFTSDGIAPFSLSDPALSTHGIETNLPATVTGEMPTWPAYLSFLHPFPSPVHVAIRPSFVEYLLGGCKIELTIAIDYTGSNGDPRKPGTLHYIDGVLNDYEKAISAVGGIMGRYGSDQKISVLGFGAKYDGVIRNCFQVGSEPELNGLGSVLTAYRQVFQTGITMSGPTVYSEIIDYTANVARRSQVDAAARGKQSYRVLLILTDGFVSDREQLELSLKKAMDAPLSVVIFGIGNPNFDNMIRSDDFTDNFNGYLRNCQLVEFSRHEDDKSALAAATLEEIPDQLVDYFYGKGISPTLPVSVNNNDTNNSISLEEDSDEPLNINFTSDGVPNLINHQGCVFHDNEYEQLQTFLSPRFTNNSQRLYPSTADETGFGVRVPANDAAGSELLFHDPYTRNNTIVVKVPEGVPPGGTFGVKPLYVPSVIELTPVSLRAPVSPSVTFFDGSRTKLELTAKQINRETMPQWDDDLGNAVKHARDVESQLDNLPVVGTLLQFDEKDCKIKNGGKNNKLSWWGRFVIATLISPSSRSVLTTQSTVTTVLTTGNRAGIPKTTSSLPRLHHSMIFIIFIVVIIIVAYIIYCVT